jgi:hypothetical protein
MITPEEREGLADIVFSKGWRIVEKIFLFRADTLRKTFETCSVEELEALQARLDENLATLAEIRKEAKKTKKEDMDYD